MFTWFDANGFFSFGLREEELRSGKWGSLVWRQYVVKQFIVWSFLYKGIKNKIDEVRICSSFKNEKEIYWSAVEGWSFW
jgi:hypothetical protein